MMFSRIPALVTILGIAGFGIAAFLSPSAQAETTIESGDLIRGQSFSAVYYMGEDGFRYVFPNDKTFFTWYEDFSDVKWISDAELAAIQIGGNVTYKPESRMIKINTDPKVYTVWNNGYLYWVETEEMAESLYGADWNKQIDDIPDGFFSNYTFTGETADGSMVDHDRSDLTINEDKDLVAPADVTINNSTYSDVNITISAGGTVRFTNNEDMKHTATADDGSWGTGTLNQGDSFVKKFTEPGTYSYYCSYHPSMTGTITVE